MEDVVVIGAGLSGLTAAGQLHQRGYRVRVVDKSRGLGGRVATRRLATTSLDHGCRYLHPFADPALSPIPALLASGILQPWQPETFALEANGSIRATATATLYAAPQGMSAVAKALAAGLTIHRHWRATALTPMPQGWHIEGEGLGPDSQGEISALEARAVVVAIPAPQAAALVAATAQPHDAISDLVQQLQTVAFDPVIAVMAGYSPQTSPWLSQQTAPGGWMVTGDAHPTLGWIALDSSKRPAAKAAEPKESVVVLHSSAEFAAQAIGRPDLESVGQDLLAIAAKTLAPWLSSPEWMQVHCWRYGFVRQPLGASVLRSPAWPTFVGCGDWCPGGQVEGAIASGHQAAKLIAQALV